LHLKGYRIQAVDENNSAGIHDGQAAHLSRKPAAKAKLAGPSVSMTDLAAWCACEGPH
jgi:hypothetical protein